MYKLKLWNGKYDRAAKFVVFDSKNKKYTEFSLDNPKDVAWVGHDLTQLPEYKSWEDFQDEPVDNLDDIIM